MKLTPAKAILAQKIKFLRLGVLLTFFALDFMYWIYDKFQNCEVMKTFYCITKVNYTAHYFGTISGIPRHVISLLMLSFEM